MDCEEMQQLWEQQIKQKLVEMMKPKLAEMVSRPETLFEISKVFNECGISENEDIRVEFKLNITRLEPNGNTQKLQAENFLFSPDGCVYYHDCPTNRGRPCIKC